MRNSFALSASHTSIRFGGTDREAGLRGRSLSAVPFGARGQQTLGGREVTVKLARSAVPRSPTLVPNAVGGLRGEHCAGAERQLPPPANWCCRPSADLHRVSLIVCVWARHLELTGAAPEHRVHDERGDDELQGSDDAARVLASRRRPRRVHRPAHRRVVRTSRLRVLVDLSRCAATDAAATPRSDCSTVWACA